MRPAILAILIALIVYGALFVYASASSALKEKAIEEWVEKELSRKPSYMESTVCKQCHLKVYDSLKAGKHVSVECESCHEAGAEHAKLRNAESIVVDKSRESCLLCHLETSGRNIASVDASHGKGVYCTYCHNPHDPSSLS